SRSTFAGLGESGGRQERAAYPFLCGAWRHEITGDWRYWCTQSTARSRPRQTMDRSLPANHRTGLPEAAGGLSPDLYLCPDTRVPGSAPRYPWILALAGW